MPDEVTVGRHESLEEMVRRRAEKTGIPVSMELRQCLAVVAKWRNELMFSGNENAWELLWSQALLDDLQGVDVGQRRVC